MVVAAGVTTHNTVEMRQSAVSHDDIDVVAIITDRLREKSCLVDV